MLQHIRESFTLKTSDKVLDNLAAINVVLGKNGNGKSTLLRYLDNDREKVIPNIALCKYLSPERGGQLSKDASAEMNIHERKWVSDVFRNNRVENFRQITFANFRRLEVMVLRSIESEDDVRNSDFKFDNVVSQINTLLDRVQLVRTLDTGFEIRSRETSKLQPVNDLSSGESELITLAIEILSFAYEAMLPQNKDKLNLLLLDEPDVHIHPDLQYRLIELLVQVVKNKPICSIIATHSTAILGALNKGQANVAFMSSSQQELTFVSISQALQDVLPIFGAHPLSNVFNQSPILLFEGEDDERIWQQAVRSSNGRVQLWPCAAGDKQSLEKYEKTVDSLIGSVYDNAVGYSLRDRDDAVEELLDDKQYVKRFRLSCRAAENLMLTNEVLQSLGSSWADMQEKIREWIAGNSSNKYHKYMVKFAYEGFNRKNANLKEIRNNLIGIVTNKNWEFVVGQAIGRLTPESDRGEGSLVSFLGERLVQELGLCSLAR